jgi:hypothetical protein
VSCRSFIHPSAQKGNYRKFVCRILHSTGSIEGQEAHRELVMSF